MSAGKCIFCEGTGLTKEHVWPVWSAKFFTPAKKTNVRGSVRDSPTDASILVHESRKERQGSVQTIKVRAVCNTCNNGWMSQLEKKAKPILIPLIKGESTTLNKTQQGVLATWATKTFMVIEMLARDHLVTPQLDRLYLMDTQSAPPHVEIFIGHNVGETWTADFARHSAIIPINVPSSMSFEEKRLLPKNFHMLVIGVGKLFVLGAWTSIPHIANFDLDSLQAYLTRVWPSSEQPILWPPKVSLTSAEANGLATAFARFCDTHNQKNDQFLLQHIAGKTDRS